MGSNSQLIYSQKFSSSDNNKNDTEVKNGSYAFVFMHSMKMYNVTQSIFINHFYINLSILCRHSKKLINIVK
jgi:hypothetical protein